MSACTTVPRSPTAAAATATPTATTPTATAAAATTRAATTVTCDVCPHACRIPEGGMGRCRARGNVGGRIVATGYGHITSLALDPVEKKPLARWRPGKLLLSAGFYGCNLRCPFCQNWQISQAGEHDVPWQEITPAELVETARRAHRRDGRVVGIAHTYNEPLVVWEYIRDVGTLAHEADLANVLVSSGCARPHIIDALAPLIDAANIDLKSFQDKTYERYGGDLDTVRATIERLAAEPSCHLEVTTLVVPGENDSVEEIEAMAKWLASLDRDITYHLTRFFPNWLMQDRGPTPVKDIRALVEVARRWLSHVYAGNC